MKRLKIGVVTARFNSEITSRLEEGAVRFLEKSDVDVELVRVPGAVEIPLACQALFLRGCDGAVALGAIIRGETTHYEVVCNSVERNLSHLMLETSFILDTSERGTKLETTKAPRSAPSLTGIMTRTKLPSPNW